MPRPHVVGSVGLASTLLVGGLVLLIGVSSVVAFNGWPGLRHEAPKQRLVLAPVPEATTEAAQAAKQRVVLGGARDDEARRSSTRARRSARAEARAEARRKGRRVASVRRTTRSAAPAAAAPAQQPAAQPQAPAAAPAEAPKKPDVVRDTVDSVTRTVDRTVERILPVPTPDADRDGLAGAADDVVGAIDELLP